MTDHTELIRQLKTYEDGYGLYDAAAAAIEELQAEVKRLEPKRGEWIFKSTGGPMGYKTCSVCGYRTWQSKMDLGDMGNYCPNCGAKMDVQDDTCKRPD